MRLYGAIQKVEPLDDGTVRVYGIATSEGVDEQGEIVQADAMRAAIPNYMRFPALREMHQLSAAGTTLEAEVGEDGTTRIVAHVVDPVAVAKVKNQVYRGFSIGGQVTRREAGNPKTITSLVLNEISLVDRPANPEAIFDCWKASIMPEAGQGDRDSAGLTPVLMRSAQTLLGQKPFNSPIQIWACGVLDHQHLAKADAVKCLEKGISEPAKVDAPRIKSDQRGGRDSNIEYADPGYQADGKKRYPIDSDVHIRAAWGYINRPGDAGKYSVDQLEEIKAAILAAWRAKIGEEGPPSAADTSKASRATLTKGLWDVGDVARVILDLDWLKDALAVEAAMGGDDSAQPSRLQAITAELCTFLNALVTEETNETVSDAEINDGLLEPTSPGMLAMAAAGPRVANVAAILQKGNPHMRRLAAGLLAKAKHSQSDQALVDMAHHACDKCLNIDGLSVDEKEHVGQARDCLRQAGARPISVTADNPEGFHPGVDQQALDVLAAALGKRGRAHQRLMDVAHECVSELTDGQSCGEAAKAGARHSGETMEQLNAAHRHLVAAGAACEAARLPESGVLNKEEHQEIAPASGKAAGPGDLAKALASERAEKAVLAKTLSDIVPLLDRLTKRVDEIARTPLPPLTIAKGTVSISKEQDGSSAGPAAPQLSAEAIAAALARMSKEEQTLTLIKASYANPIRGVGSAGGDR